MASTIRFLMVGGFLGAGKTTTLARLARHYIAQGRKVGIVTNDQAADLVDTNLLRAQGFHVGEVAGACFCCNFDELMETIDRLTEENRPDTLLAEPVGSCTDLVATVLQPIKRLFAARFQIAPYVVLLKPSHGRKVLSGRPRSGFSPKAEYILKKQLEEADAVLINRIDELSPAEVDELESLVRRRYPDVPILRISARTGAGFDALTELLDQDGDFGRRVLDIDYDTYADGEAELGWLNGTVRIEASGEYALDELLLELVRELRDELARHHAEAAHLKVIGLWEGFFGVANLISSESEPELSLPSHCQVRCVDLIVNARVACDPEWLRERVEQVVGRAAERRGGKPAFRKMQCFRPARPVPTYRYEAVQ
ncbi:MAG: cobalamin biosynthesis protein P47K [Planctomycetes bacterium]|nr:cobalamin biosynthesis protein P47K [Planctomycetota bacterium]